MLNQYGLELEFGSKIPDITLARILDIDINADSIYYIQNSVWNISEDFSADDEENMGIEIRSPIFTIFPEEKLTQLLSSLKDNECQVTPTSGLHFHFSGPSYVKLCYLDNNKLIYLANKLFTVAKPHKKRAHYCNPLGGFNTKRSALRQIAESHWECRVFNSSFDIKEIRSCFSNLLEILDGVKI